MCLFYFVYVKDIFNGVQKCMEVKQTWEPRPATCSVQITFVTKAEGTLYWQLAFFSLLWISISVPPEVKPGHADYTLCSKLVDLDLPLQDKIQRKSPSEQHFHLQTAPSATGTRGPKWRAETTSDLNYRHIHYCRRSRVMEVETQALFTISVAK